MKRSKWGKAEHWNWAKQWKGRFEDIFPSSVCEAAMATCRFTVLGKNANGNVYGRGFRSFMQSFGEKPVGLIDDIQVRGSWIELDAHNSANLILGCFGLTVDDVYDTFGKPCEGEQMEVSLHDAVVAANNAFAVPGG